MKPNLLRLIAFLLLSLVNLITVKSGGNVSATDAYFKNNKISKSNHQTNSVYLPAGLYCVKSPLKQGKL